MGLIIVGGGAHARVILDTARQLETEVVGFTSPEEPEIPMPGLKRLGADDVLPTFREKLILGVGCVKADRIRQRIVESIDGEWATLLHPSALVSPTAKLGHGVVVLANSVIGSNAVIGDHAIINMGALIDHDCVVGDYTHIGPGAILGGGARVGRCSMVGIRAAIRDHVSVGDDCTIGVGAGVVKNFGAGVTLIGTPARAAEL